MPKIRADKIVANPTKVVVQRDAKGRLLPGASLNPDGVGRKLTMDRKDVLAICNQMDFNPIRELIKVAQTTKSDYVKVQCCETLLSYSLPKLRTVQLAGADGESDASITFKWKGSETPPEDAQQITREMANATETILDGVAEAAIEDDDDYASMNRDEPSDGLA